MKLEHMISQLKHMLEDKHHNWRSDVRKQRHADLLGYLKELEEYKNNDIWISTKDELPPNPKDVIVIYDAGDETYKLYSMDVAAYNPGLNKWYGLPDKVKEVVYWRPLLKFPDDLLKY